MNIHPKEKVSFYANCPDGTRNKLFNYKVHDLSHSMDILNKFKAKHFEIKKAYHTFSNGKNIKLDIMVKSVDGDTSLIYSKTKAIK